LLALKNCSLSQTKNPTKEEEMSEVSVASKVAVLLSGGADSAVALYQAKQQGREVTALTLVSHSKGSNRVEVAFAEELAKKRQIPHHIITMSHLDGLFQDRPTVKFAVGGQLGGCVGWGHEAAPLSVEVMIFTAMMYAVSHQLSAVIWAVHREDITQPLSEFKEYVGLVERIVRLRTGRDCLLAIPFISMNKDEVVMLGRKLNVPLRLTFSCSVSETLEPCGDCQQCHNRALAFQKAGFSQFGDQRLNRSEQDWLSA